jgi:hypothetical protein
VKRAFAPVIAIAVGTGVAVYARMVARSTSSAVFLGLSAATMIAVVWLLYRAARALVDEPAPVEAERVTGRRKKELEREKAALLKALKELEFDHEMGKVSDADFREIGGQYRQRAMRVLRQLDEAGADYKALVERELKARLGAQVPTAPAEGGMKRSADEGMKLVPSSPPKAARVVPVEKPRCPDCATENDGDAVFCKKCGRKFAGAEVGL